jgi:quercetin dioxygenase-like cupin family protein
MTTGQKLERFPLHLARGAQAQPQPEFTGMAWYAAYMARTAADGGDGWLVSMYGFDASWTSWEMHPEGDETVICTAGEIALIQELPDGVRRTTLRAGEYAVNQRGTWHTADVAGHASAVFITAGRNTQHRPR